MQPQMNTWGLFFTSPDLHRWSGKITGLEEHAFLPQSIASNKIWASSGFSYMVMFDHWVPLGWWNIPDFFPEIFAEALVTFTMSAPGPLYLGGRTFSKS